ncbi:hypothetical protein EMPS_07423 [Entomortierella parvispora]|uniref:Uncharacterized protein n=1 Tax=Entomortierella parvispora TaxID=205924 RepID=A0A9P3HEG7_9FUNG|nr:hypothetical protein EMPS_07423 [Entomortierella parvispora]
MTTVEQRLQESHEQLLKLYSSIPVLTPCLEKIKTNQAEFVVLNNRLRQLQEAIVQGQYKTDKGRKQLDSVFTINKAECERAYRQEISGLKALEDERRSCLRQRDDVVTVRYQLHKQRAALLEDTRQLKRVNEWVFDRSKDEVANTDFPEELHWQLELKEYDFKITAVKKQVSKFNIALTNLARAANLTEAALMALLGYSDAAYKVWRVEYALKASQKMKLYLRVELSLSNAYQNEDAARDACPSLLPHLSVPFKPSACQRQFTPTLKSLDAATEGAFRSYISTLRVAHKTAERMVAQETQRLNAMVAYRDSIVPLLARTRRHVFQNSCLGGYSIEGWEDEQGRPLLGSEADSLVRGGLSELALAPGDTLRPFLHSSSSQSVPTRDSGELLHQDEEFTNTYVDAAHGRGLGRSRDNQSSQVPDQDDEDTLITSINPNQPLVALEGRVVLRTGRAPLSVLAPGNMLGSQILMEVDRERQEAALNNKKNSFRKKSRSRSRSGRELTVDASSSHQEDLHQKSGSNSSAAPGGLIMNSNGEGSSSSQRPAGQEREGRKKASRGLFGFGRNRRDSHNSDDAVVPSDRSVPPPSRFSLSGRRNRSSVDVSSSGVSIEVPVPGHRQNVPSISIQNENGAAQPESQSGRRTFFENASLNDVLSYSTTGVASSLSDGAQATSTPPSSSDPGFARSRVMSMDEYIGFEPTTDYTGLNGSDEHQGGIAPGSAPLIPSYEEHQHHQVVDPESLLMRMGSVSAYDSMLSSLAEQGENGQVQYQQFLPGQSPSPPPPDLNVVTRTRSRSLSPNPAEESMASSVYGASIAGAAGSTSRLPHQQHHYSFSDQTPDGRLLSRDMPPPDYGLQPPQYSM